MAECTEMKDRILWLDALKGFAIFLVILGHLNPASGFEKYIYSFHMPLFFSISGFLYHGSGSLKETVIKKGKSLLRVFLFWDIISAGTQIFSGGGTRQY